MTSQLEFKSEKNKSDLINLLILLSIAAIIGIYLIVTAVLISKDGVFYIERAQQFAQSPLEVIKGHPFGYPFMIFAGHKFVALFTSSTSNHTWIYSAQSVNLLCRILALIPLYFIGKILVGSRNSFTALLILVFLPYPAEFGSDVLRDWPNILFLACGFWAILWGANKGNWWIFGLAGLSSGLGYMVRPECLQLIIYGTIWLTYSFFHETRQRSRAKIFLGIALLIAGFLIPVAPYSAVKGEVLPGKFHTIIKSFSSNTEPVKELEAGIYRHALRMRYSAGVTTKAVEAAGNLIEKAGANLMWFFVLPLFIGIYHHLKTSTAKGVNLLITSFVAVNIIILFLRYCYVSPDLTHRYILPLTVFTIFYIPTGLKLLSCAITKTNLKNTLKLSGDKPQKAFRILIIIGICICLPKLARPIRIEKKTYLFAIKWLKENTNSQDIISASDRRLYFYAERNGLVYERVAIPSESDYLVTVVKGEESAAGIGTKMRKEAEVWVNEKKKKRLVVYKVL